MEVGKTESGEQPKFTRSLRRTVALLDAVAIRLDAFERGQRHGTTFTRGREMIKRTEQTKKVSHGCDVVVVDEFVDERSQKTEMLSPRLTMALHSHC